MPPCLAHPTAAPNTCRLFATSSMHSSAAMRQIGLQPQERMHTCIRLHHGSIEQLPRALCLLLTARRDPGERRAAELAGCAGRQLKDKSRRSVLLTFRVGLRISPAHEPSWSCDVDFHRAH